MCPTPYTLNSEPVLPVQMEAERPHTRMATQHPAEPALGTRSGTEGAPQCLPKGNGRPWSVCSPSAHNSFLPWLGTSALVRA